MYTSHKPSHKLSKAISIALMFGAAATAVPTLAQTAATNANKKAEEDKKPERIQVVGSRIRTDGLDQITPTEILSADLAEDQGLKSVGDLLRTSTVAAGSSQLISALSVGFVTAGGAGNESISMRGLGSNRTLVLLNGRRAGPAGTRGQVAAFDLNTIPLSAVERVEVLKDGASSLYGSDAVAGVINIITKKGEDGSINFSADQPFQSGGEKYDFNATYGTTFDKGSLRVVGDYKLNSGLKRGDRDFFACQQRMLFNKTTGLREDPIDPRTGDYHCNSAQYGVWINNMAPGASNFRTGIKAQYDYDGYFAQLKAPGFNPSRPGDISVPSGWYPVSYDKASDGWADADHPFQNQQSMDPRSTVASFLAVGDYELTDNSRLYGEFLISQRVTEIQGMRQFWVADLAARSYIRGGTVAGWNGSANFMPVAITNHSGSETTIDYNRYVVGVEGDLGDWHWDISFQNSYNHGVYDTDIIRRDAMLMAQDAVYSGSCKGKTTAISKLSCVDVPWLDPQLINGNPSQEVKNFLFGNDVGNTTYRQRTVDAYITGDILDLPAGPVSSAYGVAFQKDGITDTPGFNTLAGNLWGSSGSGITTGEANTRAAYTEVRVPLINDIFLVESLDVTGSARWTDVSTYGSDTTYKLSGKWAIANGFSVRASRGTSFRAPALFELYLTGQTGFLNQTGNDPCLNWKQRADEGTLDARVAANCSRDVPATYTAAGSSMTSVTSGGAGRLSAETSVSKGLGLVWTSPENVYGASVDYYNITIEGQVANLGGGTVINLCYASRNFPNDPLCNQFTRRNNAATNDYGIDVVNGGYVNIAEQLVRGVDVTLNYSDDTEYGNVRVRLDHSIQIERAFKQYPESIPEQSIGDLGSPRHTGNLSVTLGTDDWRYTWATRYVGKMDNTRYYNPATYRGVAVDFDAASPTYFIHTASAETGIYGAEVTFGIANLFDREPPTASPAYAVTAGNAMLYSQFDMIGRRAFVNVSYEF